MSKVNWNDVIDTIQAGLVWFVIGVIALCVTVLILFDVMAGTGVMWELTNGNGFASVLISLATTGLLLALMFMGYSASRAKYNAVSWGLFGLSFCVYLIDTYFDAMGADILRYGTIAVSSVDNIHIAYRVLIGGISTVGEPLATAIIVGMPVLKEIIGNAMPDTKRYSPAPQPRTFPNSIPTQRPAQTSPRPTPRQQPRTDQPYPTYHPASAPIGEDDLPDWLKGN